MLSFLGMLKVVVQKVASPNLFGDVHRHMREPPQFTFHRYYLHYETTVEKNCPFCNSYQNDFYFILFFKVRSKSLPFCYKLRKNSIITLSSSLMGTCFHSADYH